MPAAGTALALGLASKQSRVAHARGARKAPPGVSRPPSEEQCVHCKLKSFTGGPTTQVQGHPGGRPHQRCAQGHPAPHRSGTRGGWAGGAGSMTIGLVGHGAEDCLQSPFSPREVPGLQRTACCFGAPALARRGFRQPAATLPAADEGAGLWLHPLLAPSKVLSTESICALAPPAPALQAVGDVCFGSVMGPSSQRANECRIAMFLAGFPASVPVHTVNRWALKRTRQRGRGDWDSSGSVRGCAHAVCAGWQCNG